MAILYHFTETDGLRGIIRAKKILPGRAISDASTILENYAVSLTSSDNPLGHGLPDGSEISKEDALYLGRYKYYNNTYYSIDRTVVRLQITIPDADSRLVYVPDLLGTSSEVLKGLEIAGYFPCSNPFTLNADDLLRMVFLIKSGNLKRVSNTWWYFLGEIPFDWITVISLNTPKFGYISDTPAEFLGHWVK